MIVGEEQIKNSLYKQIKSQQLKWDLNNGKLLLHGLSVCLQRSHHLPSANHANRQHTHTNTFLLIIIITWHEVDTQLKMKTNNMSDTQQVRDNSIGLRSYRGWFLGPRGPLVEPSISRPPVPQQFFWITYIQGQTGRGFLLRDGTGRVLAKKFGYRDGSGWVMRKF